MTKPRQGDLNGMFGGGLQQKAVSACNALSSFWSGALKVKTHSTVGGPMDQLLSWPRDDIPSS